MPDVAPIHRFRHWLASAQRILLIAHEHPDGDAIASVLALSRILELQGKETTCVSRDLIPIPFQFLPGAWQFKRDFFIGDYDMVITLDCGDIRRTGFPERVRQFAATHRRLVNVDHHPKNDLHRIANLNIIDPAAAAAAQVVYRIFTTLGWSIDHHTATALLCGLYTDTGGFKHANTTADVLEVAADLLAHGARLTEITRHLLNARSVPMLRLWGVALDRLHCHHELGIVTSMVTLDDLRRCDADHTDLAGVVNLINTIPNMKAAILFAEQTDGSFRASVRTDMAGVDVARLAALFGGGGLKKAGGFIVPGSLFEINTHWPTVLN